MTSVTGSSVPTGDSGFVTAARHARPRRRTARLPRARRAVRLLSGLLAVAVALVAVAVMTGVLQVATVTSASMIPALGVGDLVVSRPIAARDAQVGDVVTLIRPDGAQVTHRVTATTCDGADCLITLRGDANALTDPEPYPVREVGILVARVPVLGGLLAAVGRPPARTLLIVALVLAAMASLLPRRARRPQ
ncbi:MAG TPA: signal peptidase I [Cellulomonas sp.]